MNYIYYDASVVTLSSILLYLLLMQLERVFVCSGINLVQLAKKKRQFIMFKGVTYLKTTPPYAMNISLTS